MSRKAAAAAEYYRSQRVPERLEEALNSAACRGPGDVYGHLANYFAKLCMPPVISSIRGRKVLDGTGQATLEAEVLCTVRNTDKSICSVSIPADCLTCDAERKMSTEAAIEWIQDISPSLVGIQPSEQGNIDQLLSDYYKKRKEEEERAAAEEVAPPPSVTVPSPTASPAPRKKKGSGKGKQNAALEKPLPPLEPPEPATRGSIAISAVSLGVAKCSAFLRNIPLYSHISALKHQQPPSELVLPTPLITLLSAGKSSPGKLNLMKEVMMVPKPGLTAQESLDLAASIQTQILRHPNSATKSGQSVIRSVSALGCLLLGSDRMEQPLELIQEACERLALQAATNVFLAINCAAHELMDYNKGKYEVMSGVWKSPDEMVDLYVDFISRHPAVVALVDPLRKEDRQQYQDLGKAIGSRCYILADEASHTVSRLLHADSTALCSGPVLRYTNETTVSDLVTAVRRTEGEDHVSVLGCTPEECCGDSVTDLAVGLGTTFIKFGGLLRGERAMKYNRLLAIEEDLALSGRLGTRSEFKFPTFWQEKEPHPPAQEDRNS